MRRALLGGVASMLAVGAVALAPAASKRTDVTPGVARASETCPKELLALGTNPIAAATRAALRVERKRDRPQVRGAAVADSNFDRSPQVVHDCGRKVARRSVVVVIHRRAYDTGRNKSASLALGVVVVGRFRGGWRVWNTLH